MGGMGSEPQTLHSKLYGCFKICHGTLVPTVRVRLGSAITKELHTYTYTHTHTHTHIYIYIFGSAQRKIIVCHTKNYIHIYLQHIAAQKFTNGTNCSHAVKN